MKILSIETSCDETAISIIEVTGTKEQPVFQILSNVVRSQIELHKEYGGVYPNLAKREHAKNLPPIFIENLKSAQLYSPTLSNHRIDPEKEETIRKLLEREGDLADELLRTASEIERPALDAIAVTTGPGLEPALWVGINFAKALSFIWDIPVMPVNHMQGHALSTLINAAQGTKQTIDLSGLRFPALALLISGGHTELVLMRDLVTYEKIGATKDDAVGEAFDKVARLLGLPYPGGPKISELAQRGNARADIKLPRPMIDSGDYDFSFSGIKTSVLYLVKRLGDIDETTTCDIAREFETAVTEVLLKKTHDAMSEYMIETLIVGGGVSANRFIRNELKHMMETNFPDAALLLPDTHLSTDNSIMIGVAGYFSIANGKPFPPLADIRADSNWSL